ncbi:MAG: TolC family protein [Muribaculaceae bacterium]|nr:TolC family protein [Muribaculaceae bacterium]
MKKIIISLLLLLAPTLVRADELSGLLKSVEKRNLELKGEREQMKAAGYELKEQNTLDNTSIEYSPFFRKGAAGVASSELIVSQELDFPTLFAARGKAGKKQMEALEQKYRLDCRDILIQATESYIELVKLTRVKKALEGQLADAEKLDALFTKKYNAGDATSIELNRIKIQIMDLKRGLLANESEIAGVRTTINNLNGYEDYPCGATEYPQWAFSDADLMPLDNDAEVKAAASEVESLRGEEKVAKQSWVPKLTLGYRRNTELDEASNGFVVGASFPLFSTSSKVKAAKARKAAAEVEMENTRLKVASEIAATRNDLAIVSKSLGVYDVKLIDETERLLNKSVELGNLTITDYYVELATLNERRMTYIELEYEYYRGLCVLYKNTLIQNLK